MKTTDRTTKRDFYEAIIKAMETGETNIEPAKIIEFCENEIALLDKKADKAKERAAAKKAEVDELMEKVYAVLSDTEFMTRNAVMDALGDMPEDVSISKIGARLTKLVNNQSVEKSELTIANAEGKKSKCMGYRKIAQ